MRNPWGGLPGVPPYVLPEDRLYVESFNVDLTPESPYRLRTDLLPDPFTGPVEAPVVILNRNPGVGGGEAQQHLRPAFAAAIRDGISDEPADTRHLYLRREFAETDGSNWWRGALRALGEHGHTYEELAAKVLAVEFHGYHSRQWAALPITLPSQYHGFRLVEDAVERGATILIMRGHRDWKVAVPSLRTYARAVEAKNRQQKAISAGNLHGDGFSLVLQALASR